MTGVAGVTDGTNRTCHPFGPAGPLGPAKKFCAARGATAPDLRFGELDNDLGKNNGVIPRVLVTSTFVTVMILLGLL